MKTNELKKIVEDNGLYMYLSDESDKKNYIVATEIFGAEHWHGTVRTDKPRDFHIETFCSKVVAQAILDYAYTPLEEREDNEKLI